jgi:predicted DNA-binding transcriptional regulator AlpA
MEKQGGVERRIAGIRKVCEWTGLSRSAVDELEGAGEFPRRVTAGPRSVGWYEDEVSWWIELRQRRVG